MTDKIEQILKSLLLKNIQIVVKNKTVKKGRLNIFRSVGCFIRFEMTNNVKREHLEIPFPYAISGNKEGTEFYFDYRLITLADGDEHTLKLLHQQPQIKDSKYYDRILTITVNGN